MRRTAKLGDAWYLIGTNPRNLLDMLKRFEEVSIASCRQSPPICPRCALLSISALAAILPTPVSPNHASSRKQAKMWTPH
jgi:hypothetical protein